MQVRFLPGLPKMTLRERIVSYILENFPEHGPDILLADSLDEAFIGIASSFGGGNVAVYDIDRVMDILMSDGMSREEAEEYYSFNIIGAYVGEYTPIFLHQFEQRAPVLFVPSLN